MKDGIFVGIDTSNYTTSIGIVGSDGELFANLKSPLSVAKGERGLRQSDAVFAHIKNLPELLKKAEEVINGRTVRAIGVSTRPRNKDGSYMPCFLSGVSAAHAMSAALGVPLYELSHQCGHIMATIYSAGIEMPERFFAFHISGGTTELVLAKRHGFGFDCESIGGTRDLNAGQIIDRVGVYMGMPFPAGKYMEEAALANTAAVPSRKPSVTGTEANLSGLENMAKKLYDDTKDKALVSAFVFRYLARAIRMMCEGAIQKYGRLPFVLAGGVMSNSIIKEELKKSLDASFGEPSLSADNAVGIAVLAKNAYKYEKG